jgi:hypothetical protein
MPNPDLSKKALENFQGFFMFISIFLSNMRYELNPKAYQRVP